MNLHIIASRHWASYTGKDLEALRDAYNTALDEAREVCCCPECKGAIEKEKHVEPKV